MPSDSSPLTLRRGESEGKLKNSMEKTQEVKEGDLVRAYLVTGEFAKGFYSLTNENTGSHLILHARTDDGRIGQFAWASHIEKI